MKIFRFAFLIGLFGVAYYAGLTNWNSDSLANLLNNINLQEMLTSHLKFLINWFSDQELGKQVGKKVEDLQDTLSQ